MIVSSEGEPSTGKSTWAHTSPLPIVSFSFDLGFDRAVYGTQFDKYFKGLKVVKHKYNMQVTEAPKIVAGDDITCYEMVPPLQADPSRLTGFMELWNYFNGAFVEACINPAVSTIVIDTLTLLTKYKQDAYLQELQQKTPLGQQARQQLQQIEYGRPNSDIRTVINTANGMGKNLVVTNHLRDEYKQGVKPDGSVGSMPTGQLEHDGVKDIMRLVDVQIRQEKVGGKLESRIIKCGPNLSYEGMKLSNLDWDGLVTLLNTGWHGTPYPRRKPEVGQDAVENLLLKVEGVTSAAK